MKKIFKKKYIKKGENIYEHITIEVESFKFIDKKINKNLETQKETTNNISNNNKNNEEINIRKNKYIRLFK